MEDRIHSDEELQAMLDGMKAVSSDFYFKAVSIGNHAFIEFCGLMNEYINMCRETKNAGRDFTMCNRHTGQNLEAKDHHAKYLAEKFECIFGNVFNDDRKRAAFTDEMGWT